MALIGLFLSAILWFVISALPLAIIVVPIIIFVRIKSAEEQRKREEYESSVYYQSTKIPYNAVRRAGTHGEYCTYKALEQCALPGTRFLFNVYLKSESGWTTEIDVVMLSPSGIFVIESKDYSGWVFGSESQKNWCQTFPAGRGTSEKFTFYNPIMQNRTHIQHLRIIVGQDCPVYSIIAFSDQCTLRDIQVDSEDVYVIYRSQIAQTISSINSKASMTALSENDITTLYECMFPLTQVADATKEQHIMHVQEKQAMAYQRKEAEQARIVEEKQKVSNYYRETGMLKCPRCNGTLVIRTVKKGTNAGKQFYGCSRYPGCKYTQNIN